MDYTNAGEKLTRRVGKIYAEQTPETLDVDLMQYRKGLDAVRQRLSRLPVDAELTDIKKALNGKAKYSDQRYMQILDVAHSQAHD